ncbi:MAG: type IV secretory system conjugative DNA transfer family protein [Alphaproteobacteria bacterium]|nr:type IV secretory system conjugative DNA transfer family protein [Alphaproteobacteria bacterium]
MTERRSGWIAGAVMILAGAGAAAWLLAERPPAGTGVWILLVALLSAFGMYLLSGDSISGRVRKTAANAGLLLAMGAGIWVYNVGSPVIFGLLRLENSAWRVFQGNWETVVLLVLPLGGFLLALGLLIETAKDMTKSWREKKGRKQSESDLYGKAKFLERRWLKGLVKQKGVFLGRSPDGLVAYGLEGSAMTFAPPRTGKGATIALNYLSPEGRGWQGSTVVIDPRGELFPIVARRRRSLGRRPILLDPFGMVAKHRNLEGGEADFGEGAVLHLPVWKSDTYNPLDFIRDGDEAVRDIGVLVEALMERPKSDGGNSKHFYESARSLISGYLSWVRFRMPPDRRNLKTLYELLSLGNEARDRFFTEVEATAPFCGGLMHLAMERSRRVGKEEGGSNFTTVSNQLSFLNYPEVAGHTGSSSFDPLDLADGDMDIFVVVPDEMTNLVKGWLRLWISIPYAVASRRAMQRDMLVVIDELPALGHLQPVMDGYNLAAGKGVHFWTFAQSVSALDDTWGPDARKTLMHLAELVQILGWPRMDVDGADVLSKAVGAATFESRSESRSGQVQDIGLIEKGSSSVQESLSVVKEQLVPADDILRMGPDDQFVIASPKDMPRDVIRLRHARYWQLEGVKEFADPNPYVIRKERSLAAAA